MKKVLVVDDCEVSRIDLMAMFAELEIETSELDSGNKVIQSVLHERPAAIVLDILMDGRDGFETLQDLAQVYAPPPVLAISSNEHYLRIAEKFKVSGTFQKPVDYIQLKLKLQELGII